MLRQQTIEDLKGLRLSSMAQMYAAQENDPAFDTMLFADRFAMIVNHEKEVRSSRKITSLLKSSKMPKPEACLEDVIYLDQRKLDRDMVARLGTCAWIAKHQNIAIVGASGTGKTWLTCAFGNSACRRDYKVAFVEMRTLIDEMLVMRINPDAYRKLLKKLASTDVLLIDDWLLEQDDYGQEQLSEIMNLIRLRHENKSTVFCSQYRPEGWGDILGKSPLTDAIVNRIETSSHKIFLQGASMREYQMNRAAATGEGLYDNGEPS